MKKIMLYGAFDRYNYGDILFPIIFDMFIDKYFPKIKEEYSVEYISLETVNLENIGGVKTTGINKLLYEAPDGSNLIIIGGETLTAQLNNLYLDSLNNFTQLKIERLINRFSPKRTMKKAQNKYGINFKYPYTLSPVFFKNNIKIAYNSIGAGGYYYLSDTEKKDMDEFVSEGEYFSVRDLNSYNLLRERNKFVKLSPDSATLMSEFFKKEQLYNEARDELKHFTKEPYLIIQLGYWKSIKYKSQIIKEINKIKENFDINVLLLPIGFATNHDDLIILKEIKQLIPEKVILFEELKILEVMFLIANSQFFFGTSLHGNITAMAFGVPYVGLNKQIIKLEEYLKTWGIEKLNQNINFEDIYKFYIENKDINRKDIQKNTLKIQEKIRQNNTELLGAIIDNSKGVLDG